MNISQYFELDEKATGTQVKSYYEYERSEAFQRLKTCSYYHRTKYNKDGSVSGIYTTIERALLKADPSGNIEYFKVELENPAPPIPTYESSLFLPQGENLVIHHSRTNTSFTEVQYDYQATAVPLFMIGLAHFYFILQNIDFQSTELVTRKQLIPTYYSRFVGIYHCYVEIKYELLAEDHCRILCTNNIGSAFGSSSSPALIDYNPLTKKVEKYSFLLDRIVLTPVDKPTMEITLLDETPAPSLNHPVLKVTSEEITLTKGISKLVRSNPFARDTFLFLDFFKTESFETNPQALRTFLHEFFQKKNIGFAHLEEQLGRTSVYKNPPIDFNEFSSLIEKTLARFQGTRLHLICFGYLSLVLPFVLARLNLSLPILYLMPGWNAGDVEAEKVYWRERFQNFPKEASLFETLEHYSGTVVEMDYRKFLAQEKNFSSWKMEKIDPEDLSMSYLSKGEFKLWNTNLLEKILLSMSL